ncbi:hypothetical protein ACWGNM_30770 [Streptomyces sp. NPDC055796]
MSADAPLPVFEQLRLPDTGVARDAYAYVAGATPDFVLHHSVRREEEGVNRGAKDSDPCARPSSGPPSRMPGGQIR